MLNYVQALREVIKRGNYGLFFRVIPYAFIVIILSYILMIVSESSDAHYIIVIIRICSMFALAGGVFYFIRIKKVNPANVVFYEILLAVTLPVCQSIALLCSESQLHLYSAVVIGGLFYGLLGGYFLMPVLLSPLLYYLSYLMHIVLKCSAVSVLSDERLSVFIVMWFSAVAASAVRIGFDVFYLLRVSMHEHALHLESFRKLQESARHRLELEKELRKMENVETLGLYAGGIAHDFNNMLTIIAGQMMSLRRTAKDETEKENIESIMQAVKKTSGLIKKLLLFTGQYENHKKEFELNEIIESTVELLRHGTEKKNNINCRITGEKVLVYGDSDMFQTSLIGFLLNVLKNLDSEETLTVRLELTSEYQSPVSENFNLNNVTVERYADLEMNCRAIRNINCQNEKVFIELMSVVNSMKGKVMTGCDSVRIMLPECKQNVTADIEEHKDEKDHLILLVDDDKLVLDSTGEMLSDAGYKVISCNRAAEAIECFMQKYKEISLVLLDMRMAEMSGRELYYKLRNIDTDVKVIMVSGFCSDADVKDLMDNGALGFIEKPYTEESLFSKIEMHI